MFSYAFCFPDTDLCTVLGPQNIFFFILLVEFVKLFNMLLVAYVKLIVVVCSKLLIIVYVGWSYVKWHILHASLKL